MKKYYLLGIAAVSALMLGTSCKKEQAIVSPQPEEGETSLKIKLTSRTGPGTRSGGDYSVDTEVSGNEERLEEVQLFVFNEDGLEKYLRIDDWDDFTDNGEELNIGVKTGDKTIVAVCNGPDLSAVNNLSDLRNTAVELASCNDPDDSFIMYGEEECEIPNKVDVECNVVVTRFVNKVYIASVTNNLSPQFGNLTIEYAFLANVPGKTSLGGTVAATPWLNRHGRCNETPLVEKHIIDGTTYMADAPKLTFAKFTDLVVANGSSTDQTGGLYGFENLNTNAVNSFSTSFTPCCTKLVIAATINNTLNFYSINMGTLYRNKVYAVYLTISGPGADDPSKAIVKGNIISNITVSGWGEGGYITEEF